MKLLTVITGDRCVCLCVRKQNGDSRYWQYKSTDSAKLAQTIWLVNITPHNAAKNEQTGTTTNHIQTTNKSKTTTFWHVLWYDRNVCTSNGFKQVQSSSSRMRVIYHNWSAMKQRPHPQSVAEISHHSVLSGGRIRLRHKTGISQL